MAMLRGQPASRPATARATSSYGGSPGEVGTSGGYGYGGGHSYGGDVRGYKQAEWGGYGSWGPNGGYGGLRLGSAAERALARHREGNGEADMAAPGQQVQGQRPSSSPAGQAGQPLQPKGPPYEGPYQKVQGPYQGQQSRAQPYQGREITGDEVAAAKERAQAAKAAEMAASDAARKAQEAAEMAARSAQGEAQRVSRNSRAHEEAEEAAKLEQQAAAARERANAASKAIEARRAVGREGPEYPPPNYVAAPRPRTYVEAPPADYDALGGGRRPDVSSVQKAPTTESAASGAQRPLTTSQRGVVQGPTVVEPAREDKDRAWWQGF